MTPSSTPHPVPDLPTALPVAKTIPLWVEPSESGNEPPLPPAVPVRRGWVRRVVGGTLGFLASLYEWLFGAATLIFGLAALAAVPLLGFLSLGYLLEVGGRVARTGRLRDAFIGIRTAARLGSIVAGAWIVMLPLRAASSMLSSAQIIQPGGPGEGFWRVSLLMLTTAAGIHIALATLRGGRLRYFLWPFGNLFWLIRSLVQGNYFGKARDAVWDFAVSLRLPYYYWLGLRGFLVGFVWLVGPITLIAAGRKVPVLAIVGSMLLILVLLVLPFLQMRLAVENRLRAGFELGRVLARFGRAPWAFGFALFWTLLLALPLYLLKIEMIPREAEWLPNLFFIVSLFPSRILAGWAYGRGDRRQTPRHPFWAGTAVLGMIPAALIYVFLLYFTQYTSWGGVWSLYEQHPFLLPVPFFSM